MAHGVVECFEVVEVDEQHGDAATIAFAPGERQVDPIHEQRAAGQRRQVVVGGLVCEPALEILALADIPRVEHDGVDGVVAEQVRRKRLDLEPRPVGAGEAMVDSSGLAAGEAVEESLHLERVIGVDEFVPAAIDDRSAGRPSKRAPEGLTYVMRPSWSSRLTTSDAC